MYGQPSAAISVDPCFVYQSFSQVAIYISSTNLSSNVTCNSQVEKNPQAVSSCDCGKRPRTCCYHVFQRGAGAALMLLKS